MFDLRENEQLDDLQDRGYKIIQNPNDYCFTSDAVLLSRFANIKASETLCDLCSGSGIVPILLYLKRPFKKAFLVEINSNACDRALRTIKGNNISNFEVINTRLQESVNFIKDKTIDVVTVNPPYMEKSIGEVEKNKNIAIARREIEVNLDEVVLEASRLLKYGGRLYMVNSSDRITDVIFAMRKYKIEPKKLQFIFPKSGRNSNIFLIEGKMNGKKGIKILEPIYIR